SEDLDRTVDFFSCGLSEFIDSRDATLICMPSQKQGSVGELISRAIAARGASPHIFSVGRSFAEMLHDVRRFGITTMVAMPAPLLSFAKYARASGVALNIHDVLVSADACPDELISQITALLSCGIFPHYGLREGCLGCAVTCSAHEGMHIRENDLYCEVIADDGAVLPDGEFGELVITTLTRRAMPLVRYRT
ncbi:MAG: AMP-binding protein, partial [Oscillospiraceae bacterium]